MDPRTIVAELFAPAPTGIGLELEFFTRLPDGSRPPFALLEAIAVDPLPSGGRVTLEPGSQVEVSSLPCETARAAAAAVASDVVELRSRLATAGIECWVAAIDTDRPPQRMTTAARYVRLERELDWFGPAGRWMMNNTAALQVNVGAGSLDPFRAYRILQRIAPVLTAVFANSAGVDAAGLGWASLRQGCWLSMDPRRADVPPGDANDPVEDYLAYALAAPQLFPGGDDDPESRFRQHLTTLFPPVRPRGWFEVRCIDMVSLELVEVVAQTVTVMMRPSVVELLERPGPPLPSFYEAARFGLGSTACRRAADWLFEVLARHDNGGVLAAFAEGFGAVASVPARRLAPPLTG